MARGSVRGPRLSAGIGVLLLSALIAAAAGAPWLAPIDPFALVGAPLTRPDSAHPFGTDDLGRDVYAGVIHGAWSSLMVGFISAACATLIGLVLAGSRRSVPVPPITS